MIFEAIKSKIDRAEVGEEKEKFANLCGAAGIYEWPIDK